MKQEKNQKKGKSYAAIVAFMTFVVTGVAMGFLAAEFGGLDFKEAGLWDWITAWTVGLIFGIFLQIIVHEGGHLVFGLLTGYKFSSFRIANVALVKINGKLQFKQYSIAGTGGQCLMTPPPYNDGHFPYALYNIGGCVMNLAFSAAMLAVWHFCTIGWISTVAFLIALVGLALALLNGIPMAMNGMPNDGKNALSLGNNPEALRSLWVQLMVVSEQSNGIRVKDMNEEWFALPSDEDMSNPVIATSGVLAFGRLIDSKQFAAAQSLGQHLLDCTNLTSIHRQLLCADMITLELLGEGRMDVVKALQTRELDQMMKAMKSFPSIIRTEYVVELLLNGDVAKAEALRQKFNKIAPSYPYAGEIEGELELINLALAKSKELKPNA